MGDVFLLSTVRCVEGGEKGLPAKVFNPLFCVLLQDVKVKGGEQTSELFHLLLWREDGCAEMPRSRLNRTSHVK